MFLCLIILVWATDKPPFKRRQRLSAKKIHPSHDINSTVNGHICYFEAYSVTLHNPNGYLYVWYIGCPRKLVSLKSPKIFTGQQ